MKTPPTSLILFLGLMLAGAGCVGGVEQRGISDASDGAYDAGARDDSARDTGRDTTDACPEAGGASVAHSSPGRLVAMQASAAAVEVDGRLAEEQAPLLRYTDESAESDNEVSVRALWTSNSLYLGVEVTDDQVDHDPSQGPWRNDSFEVAVDPNADGGDMLQGDERKWVIDVGEARLASRTRDGRWNDASFGDVEAVVEPTPSGYVVEMLIPWREIGVSDPTATSPNIVLVTNDRDDGNLERFTWTGSISQLPTPSQWGVLQLVVDPCGQSDAGSQDAGVSDTSVDTHDGADAQDAEEAPSSRLGPPRHITEADFNFQTVLNAVDDLGMDPTGQDPIDAKLGRARASNTLIVFPPGTYKIKAGPKRNATHNWGSDASHFGIKGLGDKPKDVQFVVEQQPANYGGRWIQDHGGEGVMLKNFAIQQHRDRYTSADIWIQKRDLVLLEEVEWAGLIKNDNHGNAQQLSVEITSRSGKGEINRLYIREGSYMPGYPNGTGGLRLSLAHKGTMYLTDMWIEQMNSSSFRFTKVPGRVGVEGGFFKNNANTNIRGGAGNHPDGPSYVRGATVVVDANDMNQYQPPGESLTPTSAISIDSSGQAYTGMIIEDVDVHFLNAPAGSKVLKRPGFGEHGSFVLRNVRIRNDTNHPVTVIGDVSKPANETARIINTHVVGSGGGKLQANSRTRAEISDSCVESNFAIQGFDVVENVSRSNCEPPQSSTEAPAPH